MSELNVSRIEKMIYVIRGQKVMLDSDLANLYEVDTGQLNRQVRRNLNRFPVDFMFELTQDEYKALICQIGISKRSISHFIFCTSNKNSFLKLLSSILL